MRAALIGLTAAAVVAACAHGPPPGSSPSPLVSHGASGDSTHDDSTHGSGPKPKPYKKVIPADAITRRGLFITHRVDDKLYFEIPHRELDREFLMVGRFAKSAPKPSDFEGYGGDQFTEHVLRWERIKHRVILRSVSYELAADSTLPVAQAVAQSNYAPIVAVFPVETYGPDSAPVIDVTRLYTTNLTEFVAVRGAFDEKRSYVERVVAFPDNIEVEASQTSTPPAPPPPSWAPPGYTPPPQTAKSVLAHWSMVRLPEQPMMPRLFDERIGFFTADRTDFGTSEHRSALRQYVVRWRLEKKDPSAAISDPVQPIVYYIDPATPTQWVPYIKAGVEAWQKAFEAAGFSHAIVARDVPTDDSTWSMEDVRHTVVRWLATTVENSQGPNVHDPRTGEVLNGSVRMFHNIMNLERDWYFTQVGAVDPRARRLPLPDSLMGRLIQFVVVHEVGHTLGLPHNMKASGNYPADSVRSRTWVHRMGHTPSIMDYSRFNYVAQPEDSIALEDLVPGVGPYDVYSIRWGYAPIPSARTPDAEKPTLDNWAREQDSVPWYRFSTADAHWADPRDEIEAVGDADAVKSTGYGLRNIARIVPELIPATVRPGENNDDLKEMYDRLVGQWETELGHVVHVVGGAETQEKSGTQPGDRFTPLSRQRQAAAVQFLTDHAFHTPMYLLDSAVLRRIEPDGALVRIGNVQRDLLAQVLDDHVTGRLIEYEALAHDRSTVYPLADLLSDLRHGIWTELDARRVTIDPFRRNLQRAYVDLIREKLIPPAPEHAQSPALSRSHGDISVDPAPASSTDARPLLRGELEALDAQLRAALPKAGDRITRLHLEDIRVQIDRILHPERTRPPA